MAKIFLQHASANANAIDNRTINKILKSNGVNCEFKTNLLLN